MTKKKPVTLSEAALRQVNGGDGEIVASGLPTGQRMHKPYTTSSSTSSSTG
jgi:hypothetical protein